MNEQEMLKQLHELIADRRSFLTDNPDSDDFFLRDIEALEKIIKYYTILKDAALRSMEEKGENLCIWINENVHLRKVEILNIWENDNDVKCNAILYKGKKQVANIIASYSRSTIKSFIERMYFDTKIDEKFINIPFKTLIYDSFDKYLKLPKISRCSRLLQEIYKNVCDSENSMCYITNDDWKDYYAKRFTEKDIDMLKKEVEKYGLQKVITFNEDEYKILGYGDLETRFNDNRKIVKEKENRSR